MRNTDRVSFERPWEYEQAKRQERKATKEKRSLRKNKHSVWDNEGE